MLGGTGFLDPEVAGLHSWFLPTLYVACTSASVRHTPPFEG